MDYIKNLIKAILNKKNEDPESELKSCKYVSKPKSSLNDIYLLNFRENRFGNYGNEEEDGLHIVSNPDISYESKKQQKTETVKIAVNAIDVLNELERVPTNWSLEGLDEKIQILKDKSDLINQKNTKREVEALIQCLENRKKYDNKDESGKTNREYFSQFDTTNESKIQILLNKYTLVMKDADIFIPEMPDIAIKTLKKFTEKTEQISGKKPRIYVIASENDFKTEYSKRDPIVLAQSPFGFYYHILGAWNKEMIYLPEL